MPDLDRYLRAQANPHAGYATALAELQRGRKQSHWIWYVFPQIAGLGRSEIAQRFALDDFDEARAYLAHPLLSVRLVEIAEVVLEQVSPPRSVPLEELMGGRIDAVKLVSSLTLFELVAMQLGPDADATLAARATRLAEVSRRVLEIATGQGFPACAFTQQAVLVRTR